jgi:hypothetical protein
MIGNRLGFYIKLFESSLFKKSLLCCKEVFCQGIQMKKSSWFIELETHGIFPWDSKKRYTNAWHTSRIIGQIINV